MQLNAIIIIWQSVPTLFLLSTPFSKSKSKSSSMFPDFSTLVFPFLIDVKTGRVEKSFSYDQLIIQSCDHMIIQSYDHTIDWNFGFYF